MTVDPFIAPPPRSPYVSQSECRMVQDCPARWFLEWFHGLHNEAPESPPQRVGTLGHAIVEHCLRGRTAQIEDAREAAIAKAKSRGYDTDTDAFADDFRLARDGADILARDGHLRDIVPIRIRGLGPEVEGQPLIEQRLRVPWILLRGLDLHESTLATLRAAGRLGMEGMSDVVHERDDADVITDWKFRTKTDLGGQTQPPQGVDPQGAYYRILHEGLNLIGADRPVVFRQVNVYAGRWLTVDDFTDPDPSDATLAELVVANGLPTRDVKRMKAAVSAEVWSEAWRLLANRRVERGGKPATPREVEDARTFAAFLHGQRHTSITEYPVPADEARETVRDMLTTLAAHTAVALTGATPGRHLRSHPSSPCQRPWGCSAQRVCHASLGSSSMLETARSMRTSLPIYAGEVADHE